MEEGWNGKNDCATDNYDLYYKVIVKDFSGNTLSEEVGDLYQAADGTWWIAWLPVALWIKIGYFRYTINVIWAKWYVTSIFSSKNTVSFYEFVWYWVKTILYHTKHPRISIYVAVFQKKVLLIRPFDNIMSTAFQKNGRNKHILYLFRPTYFILPDRLQKHLHLSTYITPALFLTPRSRSLMLWSLHTVYPLTLRYARAHMSYWFSGSSHWLHLHTDPIFHGYASPHLWSSTASAECSVSLKRSNCVSLSIWPRTWW